MAKWIPWILQLSGVAVFIYFFNRGEILLGAGVLVAVFVGSAALARLILGPPPSPEDKRQMLKERWIADEPKGLVRYILIRGVLPYVVMGLTLALFMSQMAGLENLDPIKLGLLSVLMFGSIGAVLAGLSWHLMKKQFSTETRI